MRRLLPLVLFLLSPALAQTVSDQGDDILSAFWALRLLGQSPFALGAFVFGAIASIKRASEQRPGATKVGPWVWRGLAAGVAVLASVSLNLSGAGAELPLFHARGLLAVAFFAVFSALVAVFGRDGLKTALGWITAGVMAALAFRTQPDPAPTILPDPEPSASPVATTTPEGPVAPAGGAA